MKATHFDHQDFWWEDCECEDCVLTKDEYYRPTGGSAYNEYSYIPTDYRGGLEWENVVSSFAHEPIVLLLKCPRCDKLYIALEDVGETPVIMPISPEERDILWCK